jgi:TPR repeat protein
MDNSGRVAPASAAAEVPAGSSPAATPGIAVSPSASLPIGTRAEALSEDETCKRDEDRLVRLLNNPTGDEVVRFANELGCEKLRPRFLALMENLGRRAAPAPVALPSASPSPGTRVTAGPTLDEICKRDEDRLERLLSSPSREEAARFANELGCEMLRPRLLSFMESSDRSIAPKSASAQPPYGASPDAGDGAAPSASFVGGYEEGAAAYNRADFATAKRLWLPLAEQGDARAQLGLALMYFLGQGVQMNMAAAFDWCQKAADQGFAAAQYELGQFYEHPWRPELQDFAEAAKWYRRAADQDYAKAQDELGGMYEFGLGMPKDYGKAEQWFGKAGDLISIANMYDAVAGQPAIAAKWYRKLADKGDNHAKLRLGETNQDGRGVAQNDAAANPQVAPNPAATPRNQGEQRRAFRRLQSSMGSAAKSLEVTVSPGATSLP